jgi:polygalacturonase
MKKLLIVLTALLAGCASGGREPGYKFFEWETTVGAQSVPARDSVFYVGDYGALGDGMTMNTEAIQRTIDAATAAGGGVVKFIPGIYLTGSIYVKSNVRLHLDRGVLLRASQELADYPVIDTRVAGIETQWPSAIINAIDQQNIAISGEGTIEGRGKPFWQKYGEMAREYVRKGLRWIVDYDVQRPRGVLIQNCRNVTLSDFTLYQAGFWSVHVLYSQFVTMDRLIIVNNIEGRGPSTDGIDIDSSSDILVQNCDISCNDDNFCLKAGRDADGLRVNRPTERVVIRDCIARHGDGLFTCGSETSGSIRNVVAYNLTALGTNVGLRFKSAFTRGGTVEDIYLSDITMKGVRNPILVDMNWLPSYSYSQLPPEYDYDEIPRHWQVMLEPVDPEKGMPTFRNIYFNNVSAVDSRTAISVNASEKSPIAGFRLSNVHIEAEVPGKIVNARDWTIENTTITAKNGERVLIEDSEGVEF